jgi:hypothetical protein
MNLYRISREDGDLYPVWTGTLSDAQEEAKAMVKTLPGCKDELRIELMDVPTDKASVLELLNGNDTGLVGGPLRSWALTPRFGLKEVEVGE